LILESRGRDTTDCRSCSGFESAHIDWSDVATSFASTAPTPADPSLITGFKEIWGCVAAVNDSLVYAPSYYGGAATTQQSFYESLDDGSMALRCSF
jgi:hypothetical protein